MTIAFFKFPLENSLGGAEQQTLQLARHFQALGHQTKVYTSNGKLFRLFEKAHLPRRRIFVGWEPTAKWSLILWPLTMWLARRQFQNLLRISLPGSVFVFQSLTEKLLLTALAQNKGVRVIWWEHKTPGPWLKLNPLLSRYKLSAKQTTAIIAVSEYAAQAFISLGLPPKKIKIIYPGVSLPPKPPQSVQQRFTVGLLSRFDPEKGIMAFLQGLKKFWGGRRSDWQILIAGDGAQNQEIRNFIQEQGWESKVTLLGFINNLGGFFSKISVLAYPSLVPESFGLGAAEALSYGIPVVAFGEGGLAEIINHQKTGYLAKPGDFAEMFSCLDRLKNQAAWEKMAETIRSEAKKFAMEKMFQSFDQIAGI